MKINKIILLIASPFILTACTFGFQPLEKTIGYKVLSSGDQTYRIEYVDTELKAAEKYWNQAANLACTGNYKVLYENKYSVESGSYIVPIGGVNQRFDTYLQLYEGEVECAEKRASGIPLTQSRWFYQSALGKKVPTSWEYLSTRYDVSPWIFGRAASLATTTTAEELKALFGKPHQVMEKDGHTFSTWNQGRAYLVIAQKNNCVTQVRIYATWVNMLQAFANVKNFSDVNPNSHPLLQGFYELTLGQSCVN